MDSSSTKEVLDAVKFGFLAMLATIGILVVVILGLILLLVLVIHG